MPSILEEYWDKARSEVIRIDQRKSYRAPKALAEGKLIYKEKPLTQETVRQVWNERVEHTTSRGIAFKRLRVFDMPLPENQQEEVERKYLAEQELGEAVFVLPRKTYSRLVREHGFAELDFWAFDAEQFLTVLYDDEGEYAGEAEVATKYERTMLKKQLAILMEHAVPLETFLTSIG